MEHTDHILFTNMKLPRKWFEHHMGWAGSSHVEEAMVRRRTKHNVFVDATLAQADYMAFDAMREIDIIQDYPRPHTPEEASLLRSAWRTLLCIRLVYDDHKIDWYAIHDRLGAIERQNPEVELYWLIYNTQEERVA